MKKRTKGFLTITAISVLAIGITGGVLAHGGFGPGAGPGWGGHHGMMGMPGGMHRFGGPAGMMGKPGAMYGQGRGPAGMMGSDPATVIDRRLTELRSIIGITEEQEAVWNAYADAVKSRAGVMQSHRQLMHGGEPVTPEQRLAFHQQGLDQMQKITTASRDLYSTLTPEQQTKAGNLISMHHGTW